MTVENRSNDGIGEMVKETEVIGVRLVKEDFVFIVGEEGATNVGKLRE